MRRWWSLGFFATVPTWVGLAACDAFDQDDPARADAAAEAAAGPPDASSDSPAADGSLDGARDGRANLLSDGDFELQGCANWDLISGTASATTDVVVSGTKACRLCPSDAGAATLKALTPSPQPTGRYRVTAQLHGTDAPKPNAGGFFRWGGEYVALNATVDLNAWSPVTATLDIPTDAGGPQTMNVEFRLTGSTCIVLDDVWVERLP